MGSIQNALNGTPLRIQNADLLLKEVSSSKVINEMLGTSCTFCFLLTLSKLHLYISVRGGRAEGTVNLGLRQIF